MLGSGARADPYQPVETLCIPESPGQYRYHPPPFRTSLDGTIFAQPHAGSPPASTATAPGAAPYACIPQPREAAAAAAGPR